MPVCQTKFHGALTFEAEQELQVPDGLFGFEKETGFLLLEIPSLRPLVFVQSTSTPNLCFLSLPAQVVDSEYRLSLARRDIEAFGYSREESPEIGKDLLCLALLTMGEKQATTANLRAPLIIDIQRHCGRQVVVSSDYSHQTPVMQERLQPAC